MGSYGNNVYVLIDTDELPVEEWDSARIYNIELYEIRQDTGYINTRLRMGSVGLRSKALDL